MQAIGSSSRSRAGVQPASRPHAARRPLAVKAHQQQQQAASNVCRTCGLDLSKAPGGCDQEGRIIGGLAAVPGFRWWPIKAYRPCPGLEEAGLEYVRKGQGTNEVLFGGVSLGESGARSLEKMQGLADKGIQVDVTDPGDKPK